MTPWFNAPGAMERFRELWDAGISTSAIGREFGTTKNAIVGKAKRSDFPARPSPIITHLSPEEAAERLALRRVARRVHRRTTLAPLAKSLARKAPTPPTPVLRAPAPKVPWKPADRQCEFRSGEKPFVRCEGVATAGYPYCERHNKLCYLNWPIRRGAEMRE